MMITPEKEPIPDYVPSTVPPPGPPQSTAIPITLQWNVTPNGPNGYPGSPMWNASTPYPHIITPNGVQQWNGQAPPVYITSSVMPQNPPQQGDFHQIFLKAKPYGLGIVLIITSILEICFGIALPFLVHSTTFFSGVLFWGPLFYIIAGSLSISAFKTPNVCKVKGALALSIISSISSMIGIILTILDFSIINCYDNYDNYYSCSDTDGSAGFTILSFLCVMNLLVFCITVSLSTFGCRAVGKGPSTKPQPVFVIQNDVVFSMPPAAYQPQSTEVPTGNPPPYVIQK